MTRIKNKTFAQAFAVLLAVVGGAMLFTSAPRQKMPPKPVAPVVVNKAPTLPAAENDRFKNIVSFEPEPSAKADTPFTLGKVSGLLVWRDNKTGLVWSPALDKVTFDIPSIEQLAPARKACAQVAPAGSWNVPLRAELDAAGHDGLMKADANARKHWFTYSYIGKFPEVFGRAWDDDVFSTVYYVRCVARAEKK